MALEETSIKKKGINRLFTYAKLQQIIQERALNRIKLPRKALLIWDIKANQYVSAQASSDLLDKLLKITAWEVDPLKVSIGMDEAYENHYEFVILAERAKNARINFSDDTRDQLKILLTEAPFDVGYDNIFSDDEGNAIIIDTEFKGESSERSIQKLLRYSTK